jgi:hypothetical protein
MGRIPHEPQFPDEPDFIGLTEDQASTLATERGLLLRLLGSGHGYFMRQNIDPGRVTAELESGVVVLAQRY